MIHLDLFSGIGGFSLAADRVWDGVQHIFCDNDPFCKQVLKKHWPEAHIYEDIKHITGGIQADLVTGGFPCQPFSAAGKRRGTEDNRYLWPEMLRVIRLTQPTWVIAENVHGLATWNNGLVLEQVCTDLEAAGYTVQPFIIPAAGKGAPHKRDRIWICAYTNSTEHSRWPGTFSKTHSLQGIDREAVLSWQSSGAGEDGDWIAAAARLCSVDDGLPARMGDTTLTAAGHRAAQIKAYGNAIVPQVAEEIMRAML